MSKIVEAPVAYPAKRLRGLPLYRLTKNGNSQQKTTHNN